MGGSGAPHLSLTFLAFVFAMGKVAAMVPRAVGGAPHLITTFSAFVFAMAAMVPLRWEERHTSL